MKLKEITNVRGKVIDDVKYYGTCKRPDGTIELTPKRYSSWNDAVDAAQEVCKKNQWSLDDCDGMTGVELVKKYPNMFELIHRAQE